MKKTILTLVSLFVSLTILSGQELQKKDTLATFKVENGDDIILQQNEEQGVVINIAGYQISLAGEKKDSDYNTRQLIIGPQGASVINAQVAEDGFTKIKEKKSKLSFVSNSKLGLIALASPDYSLYSTADKNFLDLRTGKSIFYGLDLMSLRLPLNNSGSLNLRTGINLMCYNFTFSNDITLESQNGMVTPIAIDSSNKKSKLTTTYLAIPLSLSIKVAKKTFIEPSLYAGILTSSNTKYKKPKVKTKQLSGLNQAVTGASFAVYHNGIGVYCDYNLTTLFNQDQGPTTHALSAGITFKL